MEPLLLLFLIIIANLVLFWVLYGKRKFEQKWQQPLPGEDQR